MSCLCVADLVGDPCMSCLFVSDPVGDPGELAAVGAGDGRTRHVWLGAALHILAALQRRQQKGSFLARICSHPPVAQCTEICAYFIILY